MHGKKYKFTFMGGFRMLEKDRVRIISEKAEYGKGVMKEATEYCGQIFRRYMKWGGQYWNWGQQRAS